MKINDKNLAAFATSSTPVDREGWLQKRGEVNRGFQKRWFVLKGNLLFYFEKPGDREPLGVIVLEGCTIELAEDEEHYIFKIVFHGTGNRSYILGAYSQESMEQWMKALAFASYDYMKLMVSDLQRQLDEMEEMPSTLDNGSIQRIGVIKEGKSPNPPPRQRHNPFNKNLPLYEGNCHYQHQRSQSVKCTSDTSSSMHYFRNELLQKNRITFREIHNSYGRRILADFNEWKHFKKQSATNNEARTCEGKEDLLISFNSTFNLAITRYKKLELLTRLDEGIPEVLPFTTAKGILSGQSQTETSWMSSSNRSCIGYYSPSKN